MEKNGEKNPLIMSLQGGKLKVDDGGADWTLEDGGFDSGFTRWFF